MNQLTWDDSRFYLDGNPFTIHSAAMHYFRIVPEYWHDRLKKARDCGFNTIETYTCWNLHEREEGRFDFSGLLDIRSYLAAAQELGLKVILRPGPYICGEWEAGGLPAWLLKIPHLAIRCRNEAFFRKVEAYYTALFDQIRPMLASNGGPVIMVQVENEYGSFGNDKSYLRSIAELYRRLGVQEPLFTSDGPDSFLLSGGTLPDVLAVANFGSHPAQAFEGLRASKPHQPMMCGEFWCGWFDHWYEAHHTRSAESLASDVKEMLEMGASFNLYMFHGGTNFGFWNGANYGDIYMPTITSYDYDAPLSEDGSITESYLALQKLLRPGEQAPLPAPVPHADYGEIRLTECARLFQALPALAEPVSDAVPLTFEQLDQDFGYVLYRTTLRGPFAQLPLKLRELHDRAHIYFNGRLVHIMERDRRMEPVSLSLEKGETASLDILVENMGRINYGPDTLDEKGIPGGVLLGQQMHFGWEMNRLPMEQLDSISFRKQAPVFDGEPLFLRGTLTVSGTPQDTFLYPQGLKKGFLCVNGFNIGRYYNEAGPQKSLYLPAPLLHTGDNEIIVFETDGMDPSQPLLVSRDHPDLG